MTRLGRLAPGTRLVADHRTRLWRDGAIAFGGSPWGVVRLGAASTAVLQRLRAAGQVGFVPEETAERAAADRLVERGLAHPVPPRDARPAAGVEVVVPAYGRAGLLARCLQSLGDVPVVVVDDASPDSEVAKVAQAHGARVIRHDVNRGPAAARNTGLVATSAQLVAFLDADCLAGPGWLERLAGLFDDPRVGAVAPRVVPRSDSRGLLARHERARSALDMGARRALVRPGGPLGFLPSAALVVRREAIAGKAFDEDLRLGEDVDLVWRIADCGWHVRYEPSVTVEHEMRLEPRAWLRRRYDYGTSAADLERRHPGRLAPARLSAWNLAALAALAAGRPQAGAAASATAAALLSAELATRQVDRLVAPVLVGKGLLADAAALGHALRREWWPLGWLALALAPRSRYARAAALVMLVPIALEWLRENPDIDPARYTALRLAEDAAYGTGVLASALKHDRPGVLTPEIRLPYVPRQSLAAHIGPVGRGFRRAFRR